MVRVKRGNHARRRREKVLRLAKGFKGSRSRLFRVAKGQVQKSLAHAYRGRKERKRAMKKECLRRLNGLAHKKYRSTYSRLIFTLRRRGIIIGPQVLAKAIPVGFFD
jgi:large subunit ribosomal protein L20